MEDLRNKKQPCWRVILRIKNSAGEVSDHLCDYTGNWRLQDLLRFVVEERYLAYLSVRKEEIVALKIDWIEES